MTHINFFGKNVKYAAWIELVLVLGFVITASELGQAFVTRTSAKLRRVTQPGDGS